MDASTTSIAPVPHLLSKILGNLTDSTSGWSDIPEDLIHLLVNKIAGLATFIRFGAVCRLWHSVALANKFSNNVPWLILPEEDDCLREFYDLSTNQVYQLILPEEDDCLREFYDLSANLVYQLPLKKALYTMILGSSFGWVITASVDGKINVLNPLTHKQIALPPHSAFDTRIHISYPCSLHDPRNFFPHKVTLDRDPASGEFTTSMVYTDDGSTYLSFCRSSGNEWESFEIPDLDMVLDFAGGGFYSMFKGGEIIVFKSGPRPKIEAITRLDSYNKYGSYYFVECEGELLLVSRYRWRRCGPRDIDFPEEAGISYYTEHFRVFKVDLEDTRLTEMKSIGDHALFVGANSTICLPATSNSKGAYKEGLYILH